MVGPHRTLLIENQMLFAKALSQLLALDQAIHIVGEALEISEALLRSTRPEIILFDLDGCDGDFADIITFARSIVPDVRVCAMSMRLQPDMMQRLISAGADGYLVKDMMPSEFVRALKTVGSGQVYVDPRIAGQLLRRRSPVGRYSDPCDLSLRETEVVRLIVAGMSNKEISSKLCLSEKTIKNHVSRIFSKFNCTARTQAAVFAIRSGLV